MNAKELKCAIAEIVSEDEIVAPWIKRMDLRYMAQEWQQAQSLSLVLRLDKPFPGIAFRIDIHESVTGDHDSDVNASVTITTPRMTLSSDAYDDFMDAMVMLTILADRVKLSHLITPALAGGDVIPF